MRQSHRLVLIALGIGCLVSTLALLGCVSGGVDYNHSFSYPPDARIDSGDIEKFLEVDVNWSSGSMNATSSKNVRIKIEDFAQRLDPAPVLLRDAYRLDDVRSLDASVTWEGMEHPTVSIYEEGDPTTLGDAYNRRLLNAPRVLLTVSYRYNPATNTYKRESLKWSR